MDRGEAVVRSARALLGVPFRLHGRSADMGVDCVGLVALAAWRAGHEGEAPDRYGLRGGRVEQFENWLAAAGLRRVSSMVPGDIVLVQAGVRQFHVMVFTGEGFIHAHAGLRRVVAMPGESPWPVIGVWRVIDGYSSADGNGNGAGRANRRCDRSGARAGL
ncbi:MAG TPA: peptidoglycan endopeptidase [Rhizorhapis sp.]